MRRPLSKQGVGGFGVWPAPRGGDWAALVALGLWCAVETMVRRNWAALLTYPAMLAGIGCALPLYLLIRSRRVVG